jgi:acid phosphatase type 7
VWSGTVRRRLGRRPRRTAALLAATATTAALFGAGGLVVPSQAAALTTVLASADSYVQSDLPSTNFGTAALVSVRNTDGTKPTQTAYLRFTVAGLTAAPTSVQLQVYSYATSATGVTVRTAGSGWSETGLTWATAPVPSATAVGTLAPLTASTWSAVDVSSVVTGNGTYTLALTTTSTTSKQLASREALAFEPRLVLATDAAPPTPTTPAGTTATASFVTNADAHVQSDQPAVNFGTKFVLNSSVGSATTPVLVSYLKFPVAGLSGTVTSAQLMVYSYSTSSQGLTAWTAPTSWTESGLTYANRPAPVTQLGSSAVTLSSWATIDVTGAVTGNGTVGLAVTSTRTSKNQFSSRESAATAPKLVVTTTSGTTTTTTPPPPPSSPVIVAGGDIACTSPATPAPSSCQQLATSDLALAQHPDAALPLGDNQYEYGDLSDYQSVYDPSWGRLKGISYPVPGNHEYGYIGTAVTPTNGVGYFTYFGDRSHPQQPGCTSRCTSWYSWNIGSWHLIALDSQCAVIGGCGAGSPQYQWLLNDLNANASKQCVLAYWHIPLFGSSLDREPAMVEPYKLLTAKGADVVLNGHAHYYERFAPQRAEPNPAKANSWIGVADPAAPREFVVGTGGKSFFSIGTVQANSEARIANTFGVLKMTLADGGYSWNFLPTNIGGSSDSGSASCH